MLNNIKDKRPVDYKRVIAFKYDMSTMSWAKLALLFPNSAKIQYGWYLTPITDLDNSEEPAYIYAPFEDYPFWMEINDVIKKCFDGKKNKKHKKVNTRSEIIDI